MISMSSILPSSIVVKSIATGAGLCFLGYCIYYDNWRRSQPDFKKKLKERRQKAKNQKTTKTVEIELPDLQNPEAVQKFFFEQVQLGEELLAAGDVVNAVEHLSVAVPVCGQPTQLIQVLQQTLPPQVFQLLMQKIPEVNARIRSAQMPTSSGPTLTLAEDDVE